MMLQNDKSSTEILTKKIENWLMDFYRVEKYGLVGHLKRKIEATLPFMVNHEEHQGHIVFILEKFLKQLAGKKVLNVGCGSGGLEVALLRKGAEPVGLDIDRSSIEMAELRNSICADNRVEYIVGDGTLLPFREGYFDLILSIGMLEHVEIKQRDKLLRGSMRVLKPGGFMFIICSPNKWFPYDMHFELPFVNWLPRYLKYWYVRIFRPYFTHRLATTDNVSAGEIRNAIGHDIDWIKGVWVDVMEFNLEQKSYREKPPTDRLLHNINRVSEKLHLNSFLLIVAKILSKLSMDMSVCLIIQKNKKDIQCLTSTWG